MVSMTNPAASREWHNSHNQRKLTTVHTHAKMVASRLLTVWRTRGRARVRPIFWSISESATMLNVFAAAAPSHPPINVRRISEMLFSPRSA